LENLVKNEKFKRICKNLFDTGHSLELDGNVLKLREELGLPRVPTTVMHSKKLLASFQEILRKTGFCPDDFK